MNKKNKGILKSLIWLLEGIIVGFGAIMPGISGGTLCVAFGMYNPIISILSHPKTNIFKYGKMLGFFVLGGALGFVGLSGLAGWLMRINSDIVTCAFIGFIIGTFPELWRDAGEQGRTKTSYFALTAAFAVMLFVLLGLKTKISVSVKADAIGCIFCGILWGLSFIVPGLSSSTLLIFFGLYEPMLDGIAHINPMVIIPLGIGAGACVLLLSKGVNAMFQRFFSVASHCIIGTVAATTVMIFPDWSAAGGKLFGYIISIVCGAVVSYILSCICSKLKK